MALLRTNGNNNNNNDFLCGNIFEDQDMGRNQAQQASNTF